MQAHPITTSLPTFDKLGVQPPQDVDAEKVGRAWTEHFAQAVSAKDIQGILSTIQPDGWWRDIFALTWDLRTFQGPERIAQFLEDRLDLQGLSNVQFVKAQYEQKLPDMGWIVVQFDFETKIAKGRGLARLVPTPDGQWKGSAEKVQCVLRLIARTMEP